MKILSLYASVAILSLFSLTVEAQELERFVRYSQGDGEVHWGMVHGDEVYQLAGPPYETMEHTGRKFMRDELRMEAPVDPKLVFIFEMMTLN